MNTRDALKLAYSLDCDLVEISPNSNPPVCRIIDYQKFLYDKKKKEKEIKANSSKSVLKEIQLSPNIGKNDLETKIKHAIEFLQAGNKVKVDIFFKGRTIMYKEQGEEQMLKFAEAILDYGKPESMPRLEGKRMLMILAPKKK